MGLPLRFIILVSGNGRLLNRYCRLVAANDRRPIVYNVPLGLLVQSPRPMDPLAHERDGRRLQVVLFGAVCILVTTNDRSQYRGATKRLRTDVHPPRHNLHSDIHQLRIPYAQGWKYHFVPHGYRGYPFAGRNNPQNFGIFTLIGRRLPKF